MSLSILIRAFSEDDWTEYVNSCKDKSNIPANCFENLELPEDVKIVVYQKLRDRSREWLISPLEIFENNKPIDLLKTGNALKALKEALLRLPDPL